MICQIVSMTYTLILLFSKIVSAAYTPVRTISGKDFQKTIDMQHFIREYGKR